MNQSALSDLVALGEGFTTEFKRSGTSGIGREICAFANATAGPFCWGWPMTEKYAGLTATIA